MLGAIRVQDDQLSRCTQARTLRKSVDLSERRAPALLSQLFRHLPPLLIQGKVRIPQVQVLVEERNTQKALRILSRTYSWPHGELIHCRQQIERVSDTGKVRIDGWNWSLDRDGHVDLDMKSSVSDGQGQ